MLTLKKPMKPYYSETEAAHSLCISLVALHEILDKHVFNSGASEAGNSGIYSCRADFCFGVGRTCAWPQRACHALQRLGSAGYSFMAKVIFSHPAWARRACPAQESAAICLAQHCTQKESGSAAWQISRAGHPTSTGVLRQARGVRFRAAPTPGNETCCAICGTPYAIGAHFCHACGMSREDALERRTSVIQGLARFGRHSDAAWAFHNFAGYSCWRRLYSCWQR